MALNISEQDQANLQRLEKERMKPTRRQKAIALLRLAEGLSPAEAAIHAGIPKEDVEALSIRYAESGLAGVGLGGDPKTKVRLVRLGVGVRKYCMARGATLADLLRQSNVNTSNHAVYVDGALAEGTVVLGDDAVVTIVPQLSNAASDEPWRATISSFRDETLFREYTESLNARRRDLGPDENPES